MFTGVYWGAISQGWWMNALSKAWALNATLIFLHDHWIVLDKADDTGWCGKDRSLTCFFLPTATCLPPQAWLAQHSSDLRKAVAATIDPNLNWEDNFNRAGVVALLPVGDHKNGKFWDVVNFDPDNDFKGMPEGSESYLEKQRALFKTLHTPYRSSCVYMGAESCDPLTWQRAQATLLLQRPNFRFKALTEQAEAAFMQHYGNPLFGRGSGNACAAIHVRHGDKLTELQMGKDNPSWGLAEEAELKAREGFNHSGLEYVAKARELAKSAGIDVRTIFVMTDDQDVIDELRAAKKKLGLTFLWVESAARTRNSKLPSDHMGLPAHGALEHLSGYEVLGDQHQAHAFGDLYLAVQLAARCEIFVGDRESTISETIYLTACGNNGECPLLFDWAKDLETHR